MRIHLNCVRPWLTAALLVALITPAGAAPTQRSSTTALTNFVGRFCLECHDTATRKGNLDLEITSPTDLSATNYPLWVRIHDRVANGEMPPPKKLERPSAKELAAFTNVLGRELLAEGQAQTRLTGRATRRRLNRHEYEATLRDLLSLPYLDVKDFLPEDTEAHGFNKVGDALDVSYVQMARYLAAADFALRQAMAPQVTRPETKVTRYPTWEQGEFFGAINLAGPKERRTFPLLGLELQRDIMALDKPRRINPADPARRDEEALGVVVSTYEPTEIRFGKFRAPVSGRYRLRFAAYSFWIDPKFTNVTAGRRDEPVTIYSDRSPRILRKLGSFDVRPQSSVNALEVDLLAGETIRPDAARLHRSRPPDHKNPLTTPEGMPGVAFQWMEVEGPLLESWPPASHRGLFDDLPLEAAPVTNGVGRSRVVAGVRAVSAQPEADARRLLHSFMTRAYRTPVDPADEERFLTVIRRALEAGHPLTEALLAGYTAVLCSPGFLYLHDDRPGELDDLALAERLSYFLWNSAPDAELRDLAARGRLHRPNVLRAQVNRLLDHPNSRRFVEAFLDYWLDLRGIANSAPDTELYPDYQLDDLLVESMTDETQQFFAELLLHDLGITNLVNADFAFLNERLAQHYGLGNVTGVALRKVALPTESVRGGLLTQASVLKVTANGTSTSPIKRGAWVMTRILGRPPPPPPVAVSAVDPDIRGATTIREQLAKHRHQESCNACHRLIDPAGFALESFDVMGGWRERYRAVGGGQPVKGIGHNGLYYHFGLGPEVDPSGELPDGRAFANVVELKRCLARDDAQLARNLARQLTIFATGAPIRFADRPEIEKMLTQTRANGYGVRSLIHAVVASELFRNK